MTRGRRRLARLLGAIALTLASRPALAQKELSPSDTTHMTAADSAADAQLMAEMEAYHREHFPAFPPRFGLTALGYRYSIPFRHSGYIGVGRVEGFGGGLDQHTGVILELGKGGGELSLSHGRFNGHVGLVFLRGQLTALRTWGDPLVVAPGRDFLGVEAKAGMFVLNLSIGFMWRVDGGPGQRWFVPIGWQLGS